jgi:TPR repeat protein
LSKDQHQTVDLFREATNADHVVAAHTYAIIFSRCEVGYFHLAEARWYYEQSTDAHYPPTLFDYAQLLWIDEWIGQNRTQVAEHLRKAANSSNPIALSVEFHWAELS